MVSRLVTSQRDPRAPPALTTSESRYVVDRLHLRGSASFMLPGGQFWEKIRMEGFIAHWGYLAISRCRVGTWPCSRGLAMAWG
jgi:hypothetical protein